MAKPNATYDSFSVAARVLRQTAIAVGGSAITTALVMWILVGSDADRTMAVGEIWRVAILLSVASPALICPVMAFPVAILLRDLRAAQGALAAAAMMDPLTGLLNRRGFELAASEAFEAGAEGASALMCDLDFFKSINDRFGHEFGDDVLRQVADRLRLILAPRKAVLARQGGEEFIVLLPDARLDEAAELAEGIRAACEGEALEIAGVHANITVSIGVASAGGRSGTEVRELIGRADAAMYQAKRDGRNRVVLASDSMSSSLAA